MKIISTIVTCKDSVIKVRAIALLLSKQEVKLDIPQVYHPIIYPKQKIDMQHSVSEFKHARHEIQNFL